MIRGTSSLLCVVLFSIVSVLCGALEVGKLDRVSILVFSAAWLIYLVMEDQGFWQRDEDVTCCGQCKRSFSWFFRRHHCRCCGMIFCADCTPYTSPVPFRGVTQNVRVCHECLKSIRFSTAAGGAGRGSSNSGLVSGSGSQSMPSVEASPSASYPAREEDLVHEAEQRSGAAFPSSQKHQEVEEAEEAAAVAASASAAEGGSVEMDVDSEVSSVVEVVSRGSSTNEFVGLPSVVTDEKSGMRRCEEQCRLFDIPLLKQEPVEPGTEVVYNVETESLVLSIPAVEDVGTLFPLPVSSGAALSALLDPLLPFAPPVGVDINASLRHLAKSVSLTCQPAQPIGSSNVVYQEILFQ